jgi:hypothetical protein
MYERWLNGMRKFVCWKITNRPLYTSVVQNIFMCTGETDGAIILSLYEIWGFQDDECLDSGPMGHEAVVHLNDSEHIWFHTKDKIGESNRCVYVTTWRHERKNSIFKKEFVEYYILVYMTENFKNI